MSKAGISVFNRYVSHIYINRQTIKIFHKKIDCGSSMYCKAFLIRDEWKYTQ